MNINTSVRLLQCVPSTYGEIESHHAPYKEPDFLQGYPEACTNLDENGVVARED